MAKIETWFTQDLNMAVKPRSFPGEVFSNDSLGNLIGVEVTKDGEPFALTGSVNGYCVLSNGETIPVAGNRSGNKASIVLPQTAYSVRGVIKITLKLTNGNETTTLLQVVGAVDQSVTGNMVNPGSVVQDWSQQIAAALQELQDAENNFVRVDTDSQGLTETKKSNGRTNIDAASVSDVDDLKSAINAGKDLYHFPWVRYTLGGDGAQSPSTTRISTSKAYAFNGDVTIVFPSGMKGWVYYYSVETISSANYAGRIGSDWVTGTFTFTPASGRYYAFLVAYTDNREINTDAANGITISTVSSIGTIRQQISDIDQKFQSDIDSINNNLFSESQQEFGVAYGRIKENGGWEAQSGKYNVGTSSFYLMTNGGKVKNLSASTNLFVCTYTAESLDAVTGTQTITGIGEVNIPVGNYVRFSVSKVDGTEFASLADAKSNINLVGYANKIDQLDAEIDAEIADVNIQINALEAEIDDIVSQEDDLGITKQHITGWSKGGINPDGSESPSSDIRIRTNTRAEYLCVGVEPGYRYTILCYKQDGTPKTGGYFVPYGRRFTSTDPWITEETNLSEYADTLGEYKYFRFVLAKEDNTALDVSDADKFYYRNDDYFVDGTLEEPNKAASSMITGERIDEIQRNISLEFGELNTSTGEEATSQTKVRSGYISVKKGTVIQSVYYMDVFAYTYDKQYLHRSYNLRQPYQYLTKYECEEDGFIRIVFVGGNYETAGTVAITSTELVCMPDVVMIDGLTTINQKSYANEILRIRAMDGLSKLEDRLNDINADPYKDTYLRRGKLHKSGNNILDSQNNPVILTGFGTHFISEYYDLYTQDVFKTLVYYGCNCVRMTFYINDLYAVGMNRSQGFGWINHKEQLKVIADRLINEATAQGLYLIIDWHTLYNDGDVTQYASEQLAFFKYFADAYLPTHNNLLWELQNEPWANTSEEMLSTNKACLDYIRSIDPNAVIICGVGHENTTATEAEVMNQLYNVQNNMDVFISRHIYTASETVDAYIKPIIDAGVPLFVSEWGNSEATGFGNYDDEEAQYMFDLLRESGVSYCLWKLCYQDLTTAILDHDPIRIQYGYRYGGWHDSDLTHNGKFYFKNIWQERFGT